MIGNHAKLILQIHKVKKKVLLEQNMNSEGTKGLLVK